MSRMKARTPPRKPKAALAEKRAQRKAEANKGGQDKDKDKGRNQQMAEKPIPRRSRR